MNQKEVIAVLERYGYKITFGPDGVPIFPNFTEIPEHIKTAIRVTQRTHGYNRADRRKMGVAQYRDQKHERNEKAKLAKYA